VHIDAEPAVLSTKLNHSVTLLAMQLSPDGISCSCVQVSFPRKRESNSARTFGTRLRVDDTVCCAAKDTGFPLARE
jgi:hypothetical protein